MPDRGGPHERRQQTLVPGWSMVRGAIEIEYGYRLAEDWPDGHRAGQAMTLRGASFFTLRDGGIAKLVDYR